MTVVAWADIGNDADEFVVGDITWYSVNPWYQRVLREGEEVFALSSAPIGLKASELPAGSETVQHEGETYYWGRAGFWQKVGGSYVVVAPPVGAEVRSIPENAQSEADGEATIYSYGDLYFTQENGAYRVQPQPPREEIESIPPGSPSFVADDEKYHYVDNAFYVAFQENDSVGFVNGEPEIGAQVDELPAEATAVEDEGITYYQFDTIFFDAVEDEASGQVFYEVIGSPDGSDEVVEN